MADEDPHAHEAAVDLLLEAPVPLRPDDLGVLVLVALRELVGRTVAELAEEHRFGQFDRALVGELEFADDPCRMPPRQFAIGHRLEQRAASIDRLLPRLGPLGIGECREVLRERRGGAEDLERVEATLEKRARTDVPDVRRGDRAQRRGEHRLADASHLLLPVLGERGVERRNLLLRRDAGDLLHPEPVQRLGRYCASRPMRRFTRSSPAWYRL